MKKRREKICIFLLAVIVAIDCTVVPVYAESFSSVSENGLIQAESQETETIEAEADNVNDKEEESKEPDYIKGRPLTEEEIENQEALVPKLWDIQLPDISFSLPTSQPMAAYYSRASLKEKYDPREEMAVTSVKNQGGSDGCWAFTTIAALEQAAILQGMGNCNTDYSENHLSYFLYNRNTDPLGGTEGDYNDTREGKTYLSNGGNLLMAAFSLATWSGTVNESVSPFTGTAYTVSPSYEYCSDLKIKNAYFIGSNPDNSMNIAAIKNAIESYGAVGVQCGYYSQYYNAGTAAYHSTEKNVNHAVLLVGWDDSYDRENFRENFRPENNGAFIAKNSWGPSWGDGGFFYLSYEDASMCLPVAYEVMAADDYNNSYQYDGSISLNYWSIPNGGQVGSIFTVQENDNGYGENVSAIQLALQSANVNYAIQVYKNVKDMTNPASGIPALSEPVTGTTAMAGIYTIDLEQDIFVGCKENYGVVVTVSSNDTNVVNVFGELSGDAGWLSWTAAAKEGQSFYRSTTARSWTDASKLSASSGGIVKKYASSMRLKAFTNDTDIVTPGYVKEEPAKPVENVPAKPTEPTKPVEQEKTPVAVSKVSVKKIANQVYTGKTIKPSVVLTYNGAALVKNKDYVLTYKNNKKTGKATVTISGKGNYTGTRKVYFYIVPKKASIKKVTALGSKKLQVTWKRNTTASGYQLQIATNKQFTKGKKTYNIKTNKTTLKTIKNLKKGRKYYVRIRAYKTVSGKKYYGKFSVIKAVKVK